jgi:hypothetical protein
MRVVSYHGGLSMEEEEFPLLTRKWRAYISVGAKAETPPFARSLRCIAAALTETKQAGTPFA